MGARRLCADRLWGKSCLGYSVQARFDGESIARLADVQDQIAALANVPALHWTPPATMHVSLFSIVPVRWPEVGKSEMWDRLRAPVLSAVAAARWPGRIVLRLNELAFTDTALILFSPDQAAPVRRLRAGLNAVAAAGGLPAQTFDRTHVTLGRPSHDAFVEEPRIAQIERMAVTVDVAINAVITVKELIYPSLALEVVD